MLKSSIPRSAAPRGWVRCEVQDILGLTEAPPPHDDYRRNAEHNEPTEAGKAKREEKMSRAAAADTQAIAKREQAVARRKSVAAKRLEKKAAPKEPQQTSISQINRGMEETPTAISAKKPGEAMIVEQSTRRWEREQELKVERKTQAEKRAEKIWKDTAGNIVAFSGFFHCNMNLNTDFGLGGVFDTPAAAEQKATATRKQGERPATKKAVPGPTGTMQKKLHGTTNEEHAN
ncbi:MAG: hypothetical protein Q9210_003439 [Variospora velana]